jgi:hypothetical protein
MVTSEEIRQYIEMGVHWQKHFLVDNSAFTVEFRDGRSHVAYLSDLHASLCRKGAF